jgi:TolB-like protein
MALSAAASVDIPQAVDPEVRAIVLENLKKICNDKLFKDTTRMKRFLSYVVKETLAKREDRLKGYAIGLEVFDRPENFDPQADTIVRVQAGQLRRRLDLYYASSGKGDTVRIIIPKGQYAPIFEIRRNLPSLEASDSGNIALFKPLKEARPGIAVLTFSSLSENDSDRFFAHGLTAEIVNALVQFRYMRIVTHMPTVETQSAEVDVKSLSRNYDVQFILSGSVRRIDDVFRVSVNLISAITGEHIFSKIFDKQYTAENIFNLQEEIASYTAAKIAAPLGVVNRYNRRSNLARLQTVPAYEALLKYYYMRHSPQKTELDALIVEFENIIDNQPRYSSAWAIVSILNVYRSTQTLHSENPKTCFKRALSYAHKAVAIDPENALAFMALYQAHYHRGEFDLAEKMAHRSMALNPNDYSMLAYYSITSAYRGKTDESLAYHAAALRLVERPPSWFGISKILLELREGRFEDVFKKLPDDISAQSALSAQVFAFITMGHLNNKKGALDLLNENRCACVGFDEKIADIMASWYPDETMQRIILSGLRKAGLDI